MKAWAHNPQGSKSNNYGHTFLGQKMPRSNRCCHRRVSCARDQELMQKTPARSCLESTLAFSTKLLRGLTSSVFLEVSRRHPSKVAGRNCQDDPHIIGGIMVCETVVQWDSRPDQFHKQVVCRRQHSQWCMRHFTSYSYVPYRR